MFGTYPCNHHTERNARIMRVIGIVGWKNSGKTTLVVAIVRELTRRG